MSESRPWDSKVLQLWFGRDDDHESMIELDVTDDDTFNIKCYEKIDKPPIWFAEDENIDAAIRLRDFLIYATARHKPNET